MNIEYVLNYYKSPHKTPLKIFKVNNIHATIPVLLFCHTKVGSVFGEPTMGDWANFCAYSDDLQIVLISLNPLVNMRGTVDSYIMLCTSLILSIFLPAYFLYIRFIFRNPFHMKTKRENNKKRKLCNKITRLIDNFPP